MEFEYEMGASDLYEIDVTADDSDRVSDSIISFDVSDNHVIAVGFSNSYIGIYDKDGEWISGFSLETYGGMYYLAWQEDTLWIYTVRNRLAVHVTDVTSVRVSAAQVYKIKDNKANEAVWRELRSQNTVETDGAVYEMMQTLPWGSHSDTIVKHLPDGTSMECISVRKENVENMFVAVLWLLLGVAVLFICLEPKKRKS